MEGMEGMEGGFIYRQLIDAELADQLQEWIIQNSYDKSMVYGSSKFPARYHIWDFPDNLISALRSQLEQLQFQVGPYIRGYYSTSGIVLPHKDSAFAYDVTCTCLIYLSDQFVGGRLHLDPDSSPTVCIEPQKGWGVIFPKSTLHYTDQHTEGDKVILIVDLGARALEALGTNENLDCGDLIGNRSPITPINS